jgi:L-threonylcarbamoyladenylate synthase
LQFVKEGEEKLIQQAADLILRGELVAFPTETVYGLGANAFDPAAVAKIFETKERPSFDPLIVHIADLKQLRELVSSMDSRISVLAKHFWPGPLTIVLPKSDKVPDIVSSGLDTVGIRMPDHPIALALIRMAKTAIAAPSANKFGMLSPTESKHVLQKLPGVKMVLEGGASRFGLESTIIRLNKKGFEILRPGFFSREDIEAFVPYHSEGSSAGHPEAPGMLDSHYSPKLPLYIAGEEPVSIEPEKTAYVAFSKAPMVRYMTSVVLSPEAKLSQFATRMFSALHDLEDSGAEAIVIEGVPEEGLGIAIMDRLRKASYS